MVTLSPRDTQLRYVKTESTVAAPARQRSVEEWFVAIVAALHTLLVVAGQSSWDLLRDQGRVVPAPEREPAGVQPVLEQCTVVSIQH